MNKKEYLNEEWYQKAKKKIAKISLIILIIGIVIGCGLMVAGAIKQNNAKETNKQLAKEAEEKAKKTSETLQARLEEIIKQKEELNPKIETKEYECDSMDMRAANWFADKNKCENELSSLKGKLSDLEMEEFEIRNGDHTVYYSGVSVKQYNAFYFAGTGVIVFFGIVSLIVYIVSKRREIRAFTTQQTMPIAQEGIDKMAPTIGNAAGEIAKGISSGIKNGLNNEDEK